MPIDLLDNQDEQRQPVDLLADIPKGSDFVSSILLKHAPNAYIGYEATKGAVEPLVRGIIPKETIGKIAPDFTPSMLLPYPIQQSIPPNIRKSMIAQEASGMTSPLAIASSIIPLKRGITTFGKTATPATEEFLLKNLSAISKPSQEIFKKYGFPEIESIAKKGIDVHLMEDVIPKAQANVLDNLTYNKLNPKVLEEFGFHSDDIKSLESINPQKLDNFKKLVMGNSLTDTLNTLGQENNKIGKQIGLVEKIASQNGIDMYFPRTNKTMKGELRRVGILDSKGKLNLDPRDVEDSTLRSLMKIWDRMKYKPLSLSSARHENSMTVEEYRLLRDSLESSIGGNPKYERIAYKILSNLRDEASRQLNDVAQFRSINVKELNKAYSDNIKLGQIASKIDKAINDIPSKEATTAKGKYMNIFSEPARRRLETMFGKDTIESIRKMVAADEFWPQDLGQLGSGIWRTFVRETPKQLLRLHKGKNLIPKNGQ